MLANQEGCDVRIAGVGQIARLGATHEAAVARWVEPASRLARGNELHGLRVAGLTLALTLTLSMTLTLTLTRIAPATSAVAASSAAILSLLEPAAFSRRRVAAVVDARRRRRGGKCRR